MKNLFKYSILILLLVNNLFAQTISWKDISESKESWAKIGVKSPEIAKGWLNIFNSLYRGEYYINKWKEIGFNSPEKVKPWVEAGYNAEDVERLFKNGKVLLGDAIKNETWKTILNSTGNYGKDRLMKEGVNSPQDARRWLAVVGSRGYVTLEIEKWMDAGVTNATKALKRPLHSNTSKSIILIPLYKPYTTTF